jgi:integrase
LILDLAVKDGRLARSLATAINLPRVRKVEHRYLTYQQVADLADNFAHGSYRIIVIFLAYTGVRFGERAALKVRRLDFLRRRATIAESVTVVQGRSMGVVGAEEPRAPRRSDPKSLIEDLAEHVTGKSPDDLVFPGQMGAVLRSAVFRRAGFDKAAAAIGVPGLHPHEIRHTAGLAGDPLGRQCEGGSADARPRAGNDDARLVWASVPGPTR